jgi:hypothetical protein
MPGDHSEIASTGKEPIQGRPQAGGAHEARTVGAAAIVTASLSSKRTITLSTAPEPSITVTRAKPGPLG